MLACNAMATLPAPPDEIRALADAFEDRPAEDVLRWAAERFPGRTVLTCSWQLQSSALIHMISEIGADIRVVELDTGLLFPETLSLIHI